MSGPTPTPFWRSIDLSQTALLLSDVQTQLLAHMTEVEQRQYLSTIQDLLSQFRFAISNARSNESDGNYKVPLIIHHVVNMDFATMNLSSYNKINNWALKRLRAANSDNPSSSAPSATSSADPVSTVPLSLHPQAGWNIDEFIMTKQAPSCFITSSLIKVLHARGINHVILVGLTTEGSILSTVRHGSDLDFHIVVLEEGVWCDDKELGETVLEKLIPRFADVVKVEDIKQLFPAPKEPNIL